MIIRIAIVAAVLLAATPVQAAQPIAGRWLTENDEALIDTAPCGQALCGKVLKVMKPRPGQKSTVGISILTALVDGGDQWKGKIMNPENGKVYDAKVRRNKDGTLSVKGCLAFLCQGPTWRPAP